MNTENHAGQNILEILNSEDSALKTEVLFNLTNEEVDNKVIKAVVQLITGVDKSVKNAASSFLIENKNPKIPFNVIDYINSKDISIRNLAGEILLRKGADSLDAIIKRLTETKNDDDIKFLVDILGLIGDLRSEELIIELLKSNQNENVIVACIEALGSISSEKGIKHIITFYDKADVFKPCVIEAVGKIKTPESLKFITEQFDTDDELLRFTMIESLGEIGDENTFYFLLSQIDNFKGAHIWVLLEAIYKLKINYDLEVPFDEKIKKCVLDTIINSEPKYQIIAAHLVSVFDDPEILYACLNIYGMDEGLSEILQEKFMENKKTIFPKLYNVIDNENKYLSAVLDLLQSFLISEPDEINNITQIEKRRLTESLSKSLTNSDEVVRITAAELLFKIDYETALLFVDSMLNDENFWNRMRLLDLFTDLDNPIISEALFKLSNDPEEMVSEKAKELSLRKQYLTN